MLPFSYRTLGYDQFCLCRHVTAAEIASVRLYQIMLASSAGALSV
jgi:hypothetical protein